MSIWFLHAGGMCITCKDQEEQEHLRRHKQVPLYKLQYSSLTEHQSALQKLSIGQIAIFGCRST